MKTSKISVLIILFSFLLNGCDYLITDYELDTNPDFLQSVTLIQYIEQGNDTSLTLYKEAIKYAKMEEAISGGEQTRIVPTNDAIRTILASAGVTSVNELSPNVIKGLFSYLTIPGTYRSVDLGEEQTIGEHALSGDSLYLTRNSVGVDRYKLYVNAVAKLATIPIQVIRQDYLFKDGIAHVVDFFPTYQEMVTPTDSAPSGVDYSAAKKDTLWITEDSNVYYGSKTKNYDGKIHYLVARSLLRYTFFKFNLNSIDYADELASANLNFYVKKISGSNYTPVCGVYETSADWDETTLTWSNKPAFGQEVSAFDLTQYWNSTNITQFILNAYKDNKTEISFGLQALNGADITSSYVQIINREDNDGLYQPFISLMSTIPSELQLDGTTPIVVGNNEIAPLSKEHIAMSGPAGPYQYSDNNIIYVLINIPAQGTLTRYGLPMIKYGQFTQAELAAGAIKYVHNGNGGSDSFKLKVQDYIGGAYPDLITMNVTVQ